MQQLIPTLVGVIGRRDARCSQKTMGGAAAPPRSVLAVAETSCGYQLNIEENGGSLAMVGRARLDKDDAVLDVNERPKATQERMSGHPPRSIPRPAPPSPLCARGCKEFRRRGTNASADRWTCLQCGYVASRAKTALGSPLFCSRFETYTRGSSARFVRRTCRSCLKVVM